MRNGAEGKQVNDTYKIKSLRVERRIFIFNKLPRWYICALAFFNLSITWKIPYLIRFSYNAAWSKTTKIISLMVGRCWTFWHSPPLIFFKPNMVVKYMEHMAILHLRKTFSLWYSPLGTIKSKPIKWHWTVIQNLQKKWCTFT